MKWIRQIQCYYHSRMSVYGSLTVNYDLDIYNKNLLFWDIPRIPNCRTQVSYNNSPNMKLKINTDIDRPVLGFSGLKKTV